MKRLSCLVMCLVLAGPASAATVEANWNAVTLDVNGQSESISHYILYFGSTSRPGNVVSPSDPSFSYDQQVNVGNVTSAQQANLTVGQTYYFAVAAVDMSDNVSNYSAEVSINVPEPSDGGPSDGGPDGGQDGDPDGGQQDGGTQTDAGADSGQQVDGSGQIVSGGCSCSTAAAAGTGWLLLLLLLLAFRKRVRSS